MTATPTARLEELLDEAKPGFACGEEAENGIFQIRMNNITRDGALDLSRRRLIPAQRARIADFLLREGDVIFNATNSPDMVGKTALIGSTTEPTVFSNHFLRLRVKPSMLESAYLARWLQLLFQRGVFKSMCRQWVNQATVGREALLRLAVPLPSLAEQRRIAAVLDRADELRAKRSEALANLDDLAQSIFLDMFGDPRVNTKGWPACPLSTLVVEGDRINYGVVQPGGNEDGGVPLVRVSDLVKGRIDRSSLKHISPAIEAKYSRSRLRGNEILVSCVGSIGVVALAGPDDVGSNIARAIARMPVEDENMRHYLATYLKTQAVQDYFINELRTVSQPTLNIKQLGETRILLPTSELLEEFVERNNAVQELKAAHRASLAELDALFASVQERAFRGLL